MNSSGTVVNKYYLVHRTGVSICPASDVTTVIRFVGKFLTNELEPVEWWCPGVLQCREEIMISISEAMVRYGFL